MSRTQRNCLTISLIILSFPAQASAFVDICLPFSFTALMLILGWPEMLVYEIFGDNVLSQQFGLLGLITNLLLILIISYFLDKKSVKKDKFYKKFIFKLPLYFIILIALLFALSFIDTTCFG